jgi:hypothetical protein
LWAASPTDLKAIHIAFFSNGRLMLVDNRGELDTAGPCYRSNQGPPGVELASYTFDAATGAMHVFGKAYDTNGCGGLFDSSQGAGNPNTEADFVLTLSADGKTVSTADGFTLYRIPSQ